MSKLRRDSPVNRAVYKALMGDVPVWMKQKADAERKLRAALSLLEMYKDDGYEVAQDLLTDLERIVHGRKQMERRAKRDAARLAVESKS